MLVKATTTLTNTEAVQIWGRIFANYASQAPGEVTAVINNPRSSSIFLTQELSALLQNRNVTLITVRSLSGQKVSIHRGTTVDDALQLIKGF